MCCFSHQLSGKMKFLPSEIHCWFVCHTWYLSRSTCARTGSISCTLQISNHASRIFCKRLFYCLGYFYWPVLWRSLNARWWNIIFTLLKILMTTGKVRMNKLAHIYISAWTHTPLKMQRPRPFFAPNLLIIVVCDITFSILNTSQKTSSYFLAGFLKRPLILIPELCESRFPLRVIVSISTGGENSFLRLPWCGNKSRSDIAEKGVKINQQPSGLWHSINVGGYLYAPVTDG